MSENMFGDKTFEERKDSKENEKCGCFPDNPIRKGCVGCLHNKKFSAEVKKREDAENETSSNEE